MPTALVADALSAIPYQVGEEGCHVTETPNTGPYRLVTANLLGHDAKTTGPLPGVKKLAVTPGAGTTVWLPYHDSTITCTALPMDGSATVFITANMSGCAVYIGQHPTNNTWYACHANSQRGSSENEMRGKKPDFQAPAALQELQRLADNAAGRLGIRMLGGVLKKHYNKQAAVVAPLSENFFGGTIVVGFFKNNHWTFWYQTWGRIGENPNAAIALIKAEKFFTTSDPKKYRMT